MNRDVTSSDFFVVGGALPPDSPSYVERPADDELFKLALAGQFCYIFTTHHMGKSSLMFRTAWRLEQQGISTAITDLSGISTGTSIEQSYLVLIKRLKYQLKLSIDSDAWWAERASVDATQRFMEFLRDVVLVEVEGPIVVFVDEVNSTTANLGFFDGFLAAIRACYNARATDTAYNRLAFVLLGEAPLSKVVRDHPENPFNDDQKIDLHEFNWEEAQVLRQGLEAVCLELGAALFARIFYWTNGHPYLTQKLCWTVAKMWDRHWDDERVDELVEGLFLSGADGQDANLQFVRDSIRTSPRRGGLLALYRQVYVGKYVPEDQQSLHQSRLKLSGLVHSENGILKVRNEVYRLAFGPSWIKANAPINWGRYVVVTLALIALLLGGVMGFSIQQRRQQATQAQSFIESFRSATGSRERLISLAGLFNVRGSEDQARGLFYEELNPSDQLALFDLDNPQAVGKELITVVKGVYVDSRLINNEQYNALLNAMSEPLYELEHLPSLGAIELELEITQWLKGRGDYYPQGQYQRAVDVYNVAINMNDRNPGTYFDRGLAYAALGDPSRALEDFSTVLSLDENWEMRVRQALLSDSQVYMALWGDPRAHRALVALAPTPTNTPTSTATPVPSPTPSPTSTSSPTPTPTDTPTVTPTATPIPTATPRPAATSTPTPSIPTGRFTLLNPLSPDDISHGPTDFEWEWAGPVPPGFGFEVRVWREGEFPTGIHNAVLDNQSGNIKNVGGNRYLFSTDIREASGVQGRPGEYWWTVALVQVSPEYEDLGQQAEPAQLRFEPVGSGGDGGGSDGGGGGGVGIE